MSAPRFNYVEPKTLPGVIGWLVGKGDTRHFANDPEIPSAAVLELSEQRGESWQPVHDPDAVTDLIEACRQIKALRNGPSAAISRSDARRKFDSALARFGADA